MEGALLCGQKCLGRPTAVFRGQWSHHASDGVKLEDHASFGNASSIGVSSHTTCTDFIDYICYSSAVSAWHDLVNRGVAQKRYIDQNTNIVAHIEGLSDHFSTAIYVYV